MRRRDFLGSAVLGMLPARVLAQALPVMNVSTLVGDDPAAETAAQILREAYSRLGRKLVVHQLPGERSLVYANEGKMDGELYRKLGLDRDYPNLVIVPVPLLTFELVIFTRGTSFVVNGWDSLRPYTMGFVRGNKIAQENTRGMKVEQVSTMQQAFEKLMMGRTDLVLGHRASGMAVVRSQQLEGVTVLEPPLASFPVYHYVNKKHAALVPELARVLKQVLRNPSAG
ncbi:substrate-binding periplasmic protein [Pseudoduganella sp. OTU4001]|uniref:substrate-binding periplasmic protein n=1 Tax=Pseudoduganella sp. OTU4001 TaxID=3043854 RepID=UPI00313D9F48